ncbi:helix-turn-helix domain-containing protein [Amycolatopsis sp. NPDC023774]|uniref:helix-turn-helix domain-containing protein n=1 Tax=Amycolatopsis sp. NPDC023774 TaxID=3155015 RepID=UPI0033E72C1A
MSISLEDRTVRPPDESHRADYADLLRVLVKSRAAFAEEGQPTLLVGAGGKKVEVPEELFDVLVIVAGALERGQGVTVQPANAELTTQQAADLLGIARPTLVRRLEAGKIPFHLVGRHRRVYLTDLLEFEEKSRRGRRQALAKLARDGARDGSEAATNKFVDTRR